MRCVQSKETKYGIVVKRTPKFQEVRDSALSSLNTVLVFSLISAFLFIQFPLLLSFLFLSFAPILRSSDPLPLLSSLSPSCSCVYLKEWPATGSRPRILNNDFHLSRGFGVAVEASQPVIGGNKIHANQRACLRLRREADPIVTDNYIYDVSAMMKPPIDVLYGSML